MFSFSLLILVVSALPFHSSAFQQSSHDDEGVILAARDDLLLRLLARDLDFLDSTIQARSPGSGLVPHELAEVKARVRKWQRGVQVPENIVGMDTKISTGTKKERLANPPPLRDGIWKKTEFTEPKAIQRTPSMEWAEPSAGKKKKTGLKKIFKLKQRDFEDIDELYFSD